jgi:hypothetical protein
MGRRTQAAWLLFGGVFTGMVISGCALGSWLVLSGQGKVMTETQQRSYQHQATRIELDVDSGDVSLVAGAAGQVSIDRRLEWAAAKPVVEENWQGDTLHIHAWCPKPGPTPLGSRRCSTVLALRVPAGVAVETNVRVGTIRVNDIQGELGLSTSSGNLEITNAPGRIRARSETGDITATGLSCAQADVKTYAGDVSLQFAVAPELVKAATVMGNVEVAVPHAAVGADRYQVRAQVTDANRHVSVPDDPAAGRQLVASTSMGEVYVRYTGV